MSDKEKQTWKAAAVASNRTLEEVDWPDFAAKARRTRTLVRFIGKLHALAGTRSLDGKDADGVPAMIKLFA